MAKDLLVLGLHLAAQKRLMRNGQELKRTAASQHDLLRATPLLRQQGRRLAAQKKKTTAAELARAAMHGSRQHDLLKATPLLKQQGRHLAGHRKVRVHTYVRNITYVDCVSRAWPIR